MTLTAADVKAKAKALGADLVGIAVGATLDRFPPDPHRPQTPTRITVEDSRSPAGCSRGRCVCRAPTIATSSTRPS